MRRFRKTPYISSKDIKNGIGTLGFGIVIGVAAAIAVAGYLLLFIVAIALLIILIKYIVKTVRFKKISPKLNALDYCTDSEFEDLASDIISKAFANGYILKNDRLTGERVIKFKFRPSDDLLTYDDVIGCTSHDPLELNGVVTNSFLDEAASSCCRRNGIFVIDRAVLTEMLLLNLKHKQL